MTMKRARHTISATNFKAQCLALFDRVAAYNETVIVTKRGRAVAKIIPIGNEERRSLRGSVRYHGDIVAPIDVTWEAGH